MRVSFRFEHDALVYSSLGVTKVGVTRTSLSKITSPAVPALEELVDLIFSRTVEGVFDFV